MIARQLASIVLVIFDLLSVPVLFAASNGESLGSSARVDSHASRGSFRGRPLFSRSLIDEMPATAPEAAKIKANLLALIDLQAQRASPPGPEEIVAFTDQLAALALNAGPSLPPERRDRFKAEVDSVCNRLSPVYLSVANEKIEIIENALGLSRSERLHRRMQRMAEALTNRMSVAEYEPSVTELASEGRSFAPNELRSDPPETVLPSEGLYRADGAKVKDIVITDSEMWDIRAQNSSFYEAAKIFAGTYGFELVKILQSRLEKMQKTTVLVAMGGAEHLGRLVQIYLSRFARGHDVDLRFVPLSTDVVNPWAASRIDAHGKLVVVDPYRVVRVGIGDIPEGYNLDFSNKSNPDELKSYLLNKDIFSSEKLIVLDTGVMGSIPEAVAHISRVINYPGPVEGVMLAHERGNVDHTIPIFSVTDGMSRLDKTALEVFDWATAVDNGIVALTKSMFGQWVWVPAFQRSINTSVTRSPGKMDVESTLHDSEQEIWNYKSTLQGLADGLRAAMGW